MPIRFDLEARKFIEDLEPEDKLKLETLIRLIEETGFDCESYHYKKIIIIRRDGVDLLGFSPRKQFLSIYYYNPEVTKLFPALGKSDHGVGCLRIKKLSDINLDVLKKIFEFLLREKLNIYSKQN
ncbi:MAG TPA: hypothetical protein PL124_03190 [Candidatus Cloacimonadota bacterium]|nr:hypothetical protein [Candidatus Cloacimonadota bacterium]HPS38398.1 hypothetical protein [Candidatus Cloacimonadota bacterium]